MCVRAVIGVQYELEGADNTTVQSLLSIISGRLSNPELK